MFLVIQAWISNYIQYKLHRVTVEVCNREVISSHTYWACDYSPILILTFIHANTRGTWSISVRFRRSDARRKRWIITVTIYKQDLALTEYKLQIMYSYVIGTVAFI